MMLVDITAPSWVENYFVSYTNDGSSQDFSLPTNIVLFGGTKDYVARVGIYTSEPENLANFQAFVESTPYVWLAFKPIGATPGKVVSRNKPNHNFSLIDVEFWPFMQGQIHKDLEYYVRIATSGPVDQFGAERPFDGGPGYSTIDPEVGLSWLSRKMGTELSMFSGLNIDQDSAAVNYQSSDAFHVDATMASYLPFLGGSAGIGVNGYYLKRLNDDSDSFERLSGSEMRAGGVGPVVFYLCDIGKDHLTFEAKWSPKVNVRNTTLGSFFRIELALIF